eukprot:CAMPEP_0119329822 /NCGR_PEP_ID=MMETSP1333-20130426/76795_1 /TAXON_ID=418940 /ORGANISM="Scyphosphaera apsteinii, Strain RCC1455" /LENGTH=379 /DNA_ID=CAMNT_0007339043 /DNA_START=93 /DNA_END=1233 /DNA_ORIENTATION=-
MPLFLRISDEKLRRFYASLDEEDLETESVTETEASGGPVEASGVPDAIIASFQPFSRNGPASAGSPQISAPAPTVLVAPSPMDQVSEPTTAWISADPYPLPPTAPSSPMMLPVSAHLAGTPLVPLVPLESSTAKPRVLQISEGLLEIDCIQHDSSSKGRAVRVGKRSKENTNPNECALRPTLKHAEKTRRQIGEPAYGKRRSQASKCKASARHAPQLQTPAVQANDPTVLSKLNEPIEPAQPITDMLMQPLPEAEAAESQLNSCVVPPPPATDCCKISSASSASFSATPLFAAAEVSSMLDKPDPTTAPEHLNTISTTGPPLSYKEPTHELGEFIYTSLTPPFSLTTTPEERRSRRVRWAAEVISPEPTREALHKKPAQ